MKRVYFIKPIGMAGPIKIGCSQSPNGRRETLETWSPFTLEVVAEIDGGFALEQRFHAMFAHSHERREWFRYTPELGEVIRAIQAGTFDVSALPEPRRLPNPRLAGRPRSKWTDEQRANAKRWRMLRAIGRETGFVLGWKQQADPEIVAAYIANPSAVGLTPHELQRQDWARSAELYRAKADALDAHANNAVICDARSSRDIRVSGASV